MSGEALVPWKTTKANGRSGGRNYQSSIHPWATHFMLLLIFSDVVITWLPTVRQLFCVAAKVSLRQQQQRSRLKESSQHTCVHSSATTTLSFFSPPMSPIFVAARSKTRRLTSKGAVDHLRGLMSFLSGTTSGFVCFSVFA